MRNNIVALASEDGSDAIRALASDEALCRSLGVGVEELRLLGRLALPAGTAKAGLVQVLLAIRTARDMRGSGHRRVRAALRGS